MLGWALSVAQGACGGVTELLRLSLCGGLDLSRDHMLLYVTIVLLKTCVALSKESHMSFRKIRAQKRNLNWYEFLLSVNLPLKALIFSSLVLGVTSQTCCLGIWVAGA